MSQVPDGPHDSSSSQQTGPALSDLEAIAKVRSGDRAAFNVLYARHINAGLFAARRQLDNPSEAEDVVSEAFTSMLKSLLSEKGPDEFVRAYLLTTVRRIAHAHNKASSKVRTTGDDEQLEVPTDDDDPAVKEFENYAMSAAFQSLPERWQSVLWHLDIEGMKPSAAAPLMGLTSHGVSSLAMRAREGLRRAYLQNHVNSLKNLECQEFASQLGAFSRNGLKKTSHEKVQGHLKGCEKCTALYRDIDDVQSGMRAFVFPLIAGIAFTPAVTAGFAPAAPLATGAGAWSFAALTAHKTLISAAVIGSVVVSAGVFTLFSGAPAVETTVMPTQSFSGNWLTPLPTMTPAPIAKLPAPTPIAPIVTPEPTQVETPAPVEIKPEPETPAPVVPVVPVPTPTTVAPVPVVPAPVVPKPAPTPDPKPAPVKTVKPTPTQETQNEHDYWGHNKRNR